MTRFSRILPLAVLLCALSVSQAVGQTSNLQYQVANMVEDQRLMMEKMRGLLAEMDEMRRENARLRDRVRELESQVERQLGGYATVSQVNELVRKTVAALEARDTVLQQEMSAMVGAKLEAFGQTVNKAINSVPAIEAPREGVITNFDTTGIPSSGIPHRVEPGESIASIAKKYDSRIDWIQHRNKISDPRRLQVGVTIFVPQASQ